MTILISTLMHFTPATHCPKPPRCSVLLVQRELSVPEQVLLVKGQQTAKALPELPPHLLLLRLSLRTGKSIPEASAFPLQWFGMATSVFPEILCQLRGAEVALAAHPHLTFLPLLSQLSIAASSWQHFMKRGQQGNQTVTQSWQGAGRTQLQLQPRASAVEWDLHNN